MQPTRPPKHTRPTSGNVSNDKPWSPKRRKKTVEDSSNLNSRTFTSLTSRHSITSFLLPEDQETINQVGFPEVMAMIAKDYGFDVDVAMKAFFVTKSFEKTKLVLQHAKEAATSVLLAELVDRAKGDDVGSCSNEESQSVQRGRRAGQFVKLVKQGRKKEVDRERRRTNAFVAQAQARSYDADQRQQFLPLKLNSSTINSNQEPMDIDTVQPLVAISHKDTVQHQPPDDVSFPVDPRRIFLKRLSKGKCTLNEDEDDPAVLKLAKEHRDLVMDVTEENADALRSFEQKNNQDLMRLWSLDWVRQNIADM